MRVYANGQSVHMSTYQMLTLKIDYVHTRALESIGGGILKFEVSTNSFLS
jgi:hypothetical protein